MQVERLQEQLLKERDQKVALETGLKISQGPPPNLAAVDEKVYVDSFLLLYMYRTFKHFLN